MRVKIQVHKQPKSSFFVVKRSKSVYLKWLTIQESFIVTKKIIAVCFRAKTSPKSSVIGK